MKQAKKGFNIISSLYTAAEVRGQVRRSRVIGHPSLSKWSLTANHLQSFWGFLSRWHTVHPLYTHCTPTVHPLYTHCTPPSLVWSFSMFCCTGTAEAHLLHMYSMYVCATARFLVPPPFPSPSHSLFTVSTIFWTTVQISWLTWNVFDYFLQ